MVTGQRPDRAGHRQGGCPRRVGSAGTGGDEQQAPGEGKAGRVDERRHGHDDEHRESLPGGRQPAGEHPVQLGAAHV